VSRDKVADLRQPETVAEAHQRVSPVEMARTLSEVKDTLQSYETTTLAEVAATLAEAAESLAHSARKLHDMRGEEWTPAAASSPLTPPGCALWPFPTVCSRPQKTPSRPQT
jgi:hypothetical protein